MSLTIGVHVEHDRLRAVAVRGKRVLWAVNTALGDGASLAEALPVFFRKLPIGRFSRPDITVALAPSFAQTKRLLGLPPLTDARALARTVSEHAARFFLVNGSPLVTTGIRIDAQRQPWAAALNKTLVDTIVGACRESRVRLRGIVPAVDVTRPGHTEALGSLGNEGARFATAYGAAVTSDALVFRSGVEEIDSSRWRLTMMAGAAAAVLILAVLSPGLSARTVERRAIQRIVATAPASRTAQGVARELARVSNALVEVGAFDRTRRPATLVLAALARGLPSGTALLAVHIDTAGGSIVALTPQAGALIAALDRLPAATAPEVVGPVTRESAAGHDAERVTARFRWAGSPP